MDSKKINLFMELGGQKTSQALTTGTPEVRKLGAQLLLSELLEYIIKGLGVTPVVNGVAVTDPEDIDYEPTKEPNKLEMIDGLADVAYTMYWNACAFGIPLEEAFIAVCDNNLEKFVKLDESVFSVGILPQDQWHCNKNITWPAEVASVEAVKVAAGLFAVGKDGRGKIRKPSSYQSVDLTTFVSVD